MSSLSLGVGIAGTDQRGSRIRASGPAPQWSIAPDPKAAVISFGARVEWPIVWVSISTQLSTSEGPIDERDIVRRESKVDRGRILLDVVSAQSLGNGQCLL